MKPGDKVWYLDTARQRIASSVVTNVIYGECVGIETSTNFFCLTTTALPPARLCANITGRYLSDMSKVNIDPFSNGTEFDIWNGRNCERCVKASRYKGETIAGEEYTRCRCAIQRDILTRMYSDEPISQRTIDVCSMRDCPYRQEHYKKYKKYKKHSKDPKLFEL